MKKNGFLTFCFAFVPGAGQMYQGYMKRGLSLILLCCLDGVLGSLVEPLLFFLLVIWMYSFFDTFNLRSQLLTGTAPADDYLVHLGHDVTFERLLTRRHKLLGWGLVALGVYALYENLLMDFLRELYWSLDKSRLVRAVYGVMDRVPGVIVCLALIALGVWLVRGPKAPKRPPDLPGAEEYREYGAGEDDDERAD